MLHIFRISHFNGKWNDEITHLKFIECFFFLHLFYFKSRHVFFKFMVILKKEISFKPALNNTDLSCHITFSLYKETISP